MYVQVMYVLYICIAIIIVPIATYVCNILHSYIPVFEILNSNLTYLHSVLLDLAV